MRFQWASCVISWRVNPSVNATVCSEADGWRCGHGAWGTCNRKHDICLHGVCGRWTSSVPLTRADFLQRHVTKRHVGGLRSHCRRFADGCGWPMGALYQSGCPGRASQGVFGVEGMAKAMIFCVGVSC